MKTLSQFLISLVAATLMCFAHAEVAVIVHPSLSVDSLSADDVSRLFLGKTKSFPNGASAVPVNQDESSPVREAFDSKVLNKSAAQIKSYWSQLIFSGKGTPPKDAGADADVIKLVSSNPNIVGYVDGGAVTADVKVVFKAP